MKRQNENIKTYFSWQVVNPSCPISMEMFITVADYMRMLQTQRFVFAEYRHTQMEICPTVVVISFHYKKINYILFFIFLFFYFFIFLFFYFFIFYSLTK